MKNTPYPGTMINTQNETTVSFNPTWSKAIFITTLTWAPLISVMIPIMVHGGINEEALGTGSRYYRSPHAQFAIMAVCTLVFLFISFIPMCLSFARGYFVKFDRDTVFFKQNKFSIDDIERIHVTKSFGQNYKFILKNGDTIVIPTGLNKTISEYIDNRFRNLIA